MDQETELAAKGFQWRERDGVRALVCTALEQDGFANAFSTRLGGVSEFPKDALNLAGFNEDEAENIYENRRRFLKLFEGDWTLTACWQVHGADVRHVLDAEDAKADTLNFDALVTRAPDILIGVKTADCVPIVMGDARTGGCAAVHAGWRGTLAAIAPRAIERMGKEFDTRPEDIRAAIGPAAGGCCYEVGPEVIDAFTGASPNSGHLFTATQNGHARIDLQKANHEQLIAAGLRAERIHTAPFCTICRTDLFFSYRKEKALFGKTGRLMGVVGRAGERRQKAGVRSQETEVRNELSNESV
jgi:YfiH family protein